MSVKDFRLNEETIGIIEEIGGHMPGGFFIYQDNEQGALLYANKVVWNIFGCDTLEEFKALTGFTFRGMVYDEDYSSIDHSIARQISEDNDMMDYAEYRIVRKDGEIRWVEDHGHYVETRMYGGTFTVFISDVTEKREKREEDAAVRDAVIATLTNSYNTVWLIDDVVSESCSLYHTDMDKAHTEAIRNALSHARYTDTKTQYVNTMVAPEDRERMQEQIGLPYILKQFETKDQFSVNFVRQLDAGPRHYRIDFGKVNMPGGRTGVTMGFKDVDEEVRQEMAMREALEEARKIEEENRRLTEEVQSAAMLADLMGSVSSLLSNMPAMSFSKDIKTRRYLACNQAFAEYAGKKKPEEVIGLTDHDIFDKKTAVHFVEEDTKAINMDDGYISFEDVPDANGNIIRNLQTTKIKFKDTNGRMCLLGMCVDVTEMTRVKTAEAESRAKQHELEEKLALQEQLLEQKEHQKELNNMITAMASDYRSVYHVDLDTDEAVCYRADSDDPDKVKEGDHFPYYSTFMKYCSEYVDSEYSDGFMAFIDPENVKRVLTTENIMVYRYLAHRDGTDYYEMLRMAGVRHAGHRDDNIVHAVGVGFTIIDKEMRESMATNHALAEALKAAEEANKAKTSFLSNMSHEIRTPMNAIIGLTNIALADKNLPDETKVYMEKIDSSAHHLLEIINDILDMSRIESGRMAIKSEEFSFAKALEQVNTIIGGQCRDKGLTYNCTMEGRIDDYYIGDDMKLRQVMINILGNSVKFTPEGGTVSFKVEETARFDDKATLKFTMTDTGIGMSEDYLPILFEPFTQEDSSTTNRYGSTGLGMPITKSIVELMNGNIDVKSKKGEGTTFTVTVTLGCSESQIRTSETGMPEPHEMSVLVIDDDAIACEHAQLVLGQVGIACESAKSGAEGVEMVKVRHARQEPYNLILVDWKMPDMDGVETTRKIRAEVGNEMPIIILTSYNWEDIADEAKAAGVDTFVSKPLFAGNVMDEFRAAFRKKDAKLVKETADLKGKRVLLAEDMEVNAEIMMMILSMREIDADLAENGKIAVDMFAGHEEGYYDAILMDMRMPVMNGLEAAKAIREMDRGDAETIPIIALTANAFDEDVQRSMQAGLNAHLSKPVEPEILFKTLESLL